MLICRNVGELPVATVAALGEKLKAAAISELQELAKVCRGEKAYDGHGREVPAKCRTRAASP
jgi:hypothetical protein